MSARPIRWSVAAALLVAALLSLPATADAAFPGGNGRIAYSYAGDIWTIDPDGTGAAQLTDGGDQDVSPDWSPDGRRIAFTRGSNVFVMNVDGSNLHFLVNGRGPAWSPDGARIAFVVGLDLRTIAVDGTDERRVPVHVEGGDCSVDQMEPPTSWSPDGTKLTSNGGYFCFHDDIGSFITTRATGATSIRQTGGEWTYEDWSPDSRRILIGSISSGLGYFEDGSFVALTPGDAFDGPFDNAACSPDGTTIVFRRDPHFPSTDPSQVYLIDADGTDLRPLGGPHVGSAYDWGSIPAPRRSDYKNAAHFCKAERAFLGEAAFARRYRGGANAHGRCASGKPG